MNDLPIPTPAVRHLRVTDAHEGQRLDNFLASVCQGVPKSRLYRIIRSGEVRVNGRRAAADSRVQIGDDIRLPPLRTASDPLARAAGRGAAADASTADAHRRARATPLELPIVHEDDWLLVVDKPVGLAVHGGSGVSAGAIERLRAGRPQARFLELAHRIDRETSGLLMVAKRRSCLVALHAMLREGRVRKRYRAIVAGGWAAQWRTLEYPLRKWLTADGERRVSVQAGGMPARTRVRGLAQWRHPRLGDFSLVEAELDTGRTHQIRVHMAHAGAPLAGDDKYGDFALNRELDREGLRRMFLHAHTLRLPDPSQPARALALEAPLPTEFGAFARACGAGLTTTCAT